MDIAGHIQAHNILGITGAKIRPNTICLLGDSITEHDHYTPNSGYRNVTSRSVFGWLNYLLGQRLTPLNIDAETYTGNALAGVSGNTTAQCLARWDSAIGPHAPGYIWLRPGYNDVTTGVTIATLKSNYTTLIQLARRKHAIIFCSAIMPGTGIDSVAEADVWYEFNQWLREICIYSEDLIFIPQGQCYVDGTGSYPQPTAGYTADGIHQNSLGAYCLALEAYPYFDAVIPKIELPWLSNYNASLSFGAGVWENPLMTGTGGTNGTGSSGSVADNLTAQVTGGGSVVCSKVARTDINGGSWQQMAFTGDAAYTDITTDYCQLGSTSGVSLANLSAGDYIRFMFEFEMDAAPVNFGGIYGRIQFGAPNTSEYSLMLNFEAAAGHVAIDRQIQSGIIATLPVAIPAGSTTAFPVIRVAAGAASASFTARIGRSGIIKTQTVNPII